jgi:hypothetical protein
MGAGDGQALEGGAPAGRPAGEGEQVPHRVVGGDLHVPVAGGDLARDPRQLGRGRLGGQGETDLGAALGGQGLWCTLGHDPAAGDDRHPVGQRLRLVHVMGGEQDRLAQLAQAADDLPGLAAGGKRPARGLRALTPSPSGTGRPTAPAGTMPPWRPT